ncbi:MAG: hypothetical protein ACOY58_04115, partial [Candidatus Micrarchaeota archaeon]
MSLARRPSSAKAALCEEERPSKMVPMDTLLHAVASEVLARVEGNRLPGNRPQLMAVREGVALLRAPGGMVECPVDQLPPALDLAPLIDHTLLKPQAWAGEIDQLCDEALTHGFASVCV